MDHQQDISIKLYLRPIENIKPYQIDNCAKWMFKLGYFSSLNESRYWIKNLEYQSPWKFKTLMSNYFLSMYQTKPNINKYTAVNNYVTSNINSYGEPHMY